MPWEAAASLVGAGLSYLGGRKANKLAAAEAEANRQFQLYMASTRYQRTMEDMRKAGLNPILAYQQGGGPIGTGAMASFQNPAAGAGDIISRTASTAYQVRKQRAEISAIKQQERTNRQDERKKAAEEDLARIQRFHVQSEIDLKREAIYSARAQAAQARAEEEFFNTPAGRDIRQAGIVGQQLGAIPGAAAAVGKFLNKLIVPGGAAVGAAGAAAAAKKAQGKTQRLLQDPYWKRVRRREQ